MNKVFISHSHKDRSFTERLASDLAKNGLDVWYSEWEMRPGDSLTAKISEGIISSGSMVVILSQNSVKSKWVEKEFSIATVDSLARRSVKIFPVLLEDCTFPKSFHLLGDIIYSDFRNDYEVALRRLLSALGVRPTKRGIKSYYGDFFALNPTPIPGLEIAKLEGLKMLWQYDSLTETIELLLEESKRVIERPLLEIPVTKREASKLRRMSQREGWGYYDLADPQGSYWACIRATFVTAEPEYVNLIWLIDKRRRRTLRISWDRYVGEPLFEEYG